MDAPATILRRPLWRVLLVLALTLLLHIAVLDLIRGHFGAPMPPSVAEHIVSATLTAGTAASPTVATPPPAPLPAVPVRVRRKPPTPTVTVMVPKPGTAPAAETPVSSAMEKPLAFDNPPAPASEPDPAPADAAAASPAPTAPTATTASTAPAASTGKPVFKTLPPPSAEVSYDVQALRDGQTVYGRGNLSWHSNGSRYVIDGEAGILFFSVLTFRSEGNLDGTGIAPIRYTEKRFRKAQTVTEFERDPAMIGFSDSVTKYPRHGGEQDRASVIWQLAAIGRGDPSQFSPGVQFELFVAGVRDGEIWSIKVLGLEPVTLGGEQISAWHLQRLARAGAYDTQVDFWLAPTQQWYPVKLRQTETNGDYLDMSMSKITPL